MGNYFKNVLFTGPNIYLQGGMASVLKVYAESITPFNFIPDYNDKNAVYGSKDIVYNILYFQYTLVRFIYKLIRDRNIKIVHIHSAALGSFFRSSILLFIAHIFRKKVILHIHACQFKVFYDDCGRFQFLVRYVLNKADEVICLSDEWKTYYDSLMAPGKETIVVNNPVVMPQNLKKTVPGSPIKVLYLSRIGVKKGTFDLVEYVRLHKKDVAGSFQLTIAGAGETDEMLQFIGDHDLGEMIEYKGWITGKAKNELIEDCDVFILPSYYEGLPMAILESMSFGKPIIATPVGGVARVVKPGKNGWLTEPGDIQAMADVFKEIKADPSILTRYGDSSLQIVQDFSPEKVNEKLNDIYSAMLENKQQVS